MFKVGDIITGTEESDTQYTITNSTHKYIVTRLFKEYGNFDIEIKIIPNGDIGQRFHVKSKYFKLIKTGSHLPKWLL